MTVAIPTLAADDRLSQCLDALGRQTRRDFEVVIIDNSGKGLAQRFDGAARVLVNPRNLGYGAAINQALAAAAAPYLAALNDDAVVRPGWLAALVDALERRPDAGMCASQVRLFGEDLLDSAGMLVAADGSSKQRGHGRPPADFPVPEETLFPSGSAALYRRAMLDDIGGFDPRFFLYCEDTDLGLRARWAGWKCLYVPDAVVEHHYSHSAGRASPLKAYYVERNRLFVAGQEFSRAHGPGRAAGHRRALLLARLVSAARAGSGRPLPRRRPRRSAHALVQPEGAPRPGPPRAGPVARPRPYPQPRPHHPGGLPPSRALPLHQRAEGGVALNRPEAPDALLVIVPAFNEEGAIGGVVRSVRQQVPEARVLVIDDCSLDGTIAVAEAAAPRSCACPITWASADAYRRATSWPTNWASNTSSAWTATASTMPATFRASSSG